MQRVKAFTLVELLVVIAIIALLIGILVPTLRAAILNSHRLQAQTQAGGIAKALTVYGQSNDGKFPDGDVLGRFQVLVDSGVPTKMLISPEESRRHYQVAAKYTLKADPGSEVNYSYALLDRTNAEWRWTVNTSAVLVSDCLIDAGSVWNRRSWEGVAGFGDTHAEYLNSPRLQTWIDGVPRPDDHLFEARDGDTMMWHTGN